ncbi:zinc ribbon domain-containing protein [Methanogenium organophilum]|uniref:Zinc ribbon domain-containing protein n=1 Tax=Methanogenium organophilum TaxID=2199 RepID=A0A9X9T6C3_METOG|nr:zinc ribbon domain-containing protein [Methanogenium organophilum]WAI00248.1 zinc ribbon domain-containing protein [Methanogenium organophilum]
MFCPNCGANIPERSGVCPECGTEIYVAQSLDDDEHDPFIVAEDVRDVHTPFGPVQPVPEDEEIIPRSAIIEAEEELSEETPDAVLGASVGGADEYIRPDEDILSGGPDAGQARTDDVLFAPAADGQDVGTGEEDGSLIRESLPDDIPSPGPSCNGQQEYTESFDSAKTKSRVVKPCSHADLPYPSRRRPMISGLAVMILVVLGIAILIYGPPGQSPPDSGVVVPTPLPTAVPDTTPVPVTETAPPWTPSENLILSVSAYGGGYKVEIDNGLKANEVETILLTVEDNGGLHTMEWVYPSRHESFFMAREAYNGTASAIEHVTATATFTDGKKEVVFSGDL